MCRQPIEIGRPHQAVLREDRISRTTESWKQWAEAREVEEWVAATNAVIETGWTEV